MPFAYQWYRSPSTPIAGANSPTYQLQAADVGEDIFCRVTASNSVGSDSADSNTVGPITSSAYAPINLIAPVVSGIETENETLSTTNGTWDADPAPTYTYQWYRSPSTPIGGATSSTYVLQAADVGESIFCRVTATNSEGSTPEDSNTVGPIAQADYAPINLTVPVISGFVAVGQNLSTTNGTWDALPSPTYTYQWRSNGVDIPLATASTYTVTSGTVATTITCVVTATNSEGATPATSANYESPIKTILSDARLVDVRTAKGNASVYLGLDAASNGDPVGSWTGHLGLVATQPTTSRKPTRTANGVDLDGVDDYLILTSAENTEASTVGFTMMVYMYDNPSPSTSRIVWAFSDGGSGGLDVLNLNSAGDFVKAVGGSGTVVANAANPTTPTSVWVAVEGTGANQVRYRQSGTDTSHTLGTMPTGINTGALGCRLVATPSLYHDGIITCMMMFNGALSFADMATYEGVLSAAGVI